MRQFGSDHKALQEFLNKAQRDEVKKESVITALAANLTPNISTDSFNANNNYERVIIEYGVPIPDNVINEIGEITLNKFHQIIQYILGSGALGGTGFQCVGAGLAGDFTIGAGYFLRGGDNPNGGGPNAGFLVNCAGYNYTTQPPPSSQGTITNLPALTTPTAGRIDTIWLELYMQDYGPADDPTLFWNNPLTSSNTDVSHRQKCVALVRVWEGSGAYSSSLGVSGAPFYQASHSYFPLAQLTRYASQAVINVADITDLRPVIGLGGSYSGIANIASGASNVFVPFPSIRSTSKIFIQADPSLGGTAYTTTLTIVSRVVQQVAGGFTVGLTTGTAGSGGAYFSWRVFL